MNMAKLTVIGLSGKFGVGKDYLSKTYFSPRGFRTISLAAHFKIWIVGKGEATFDEVFHTKPPHIRHMLQQEGTEKGRLVYGEDVWVHTIFAWMELFAETWGETKFVIPDVRFPNEVEAIQKHGGKVFRIIAPERNNHAPYGSEARAHISETALDDYPPSKFDGIIKNDPDHAGVVAYHIGTLLQEESEEIEELYIG